jgi:hypothetical protein
MARYEAERGLRRFAAQVLPELKGRDEQAVGEI